MTDTEFALIAPLLPPAKQGGRSRTTSLRAVLNAIPAAHRPGGAGNDLDGCALCLGAQLSAESTVCALDGLRDRS